MFQAAHGYAGVLPDSEAVADARWLIESWTTASTTDGGRTGGRCRWAQSSPHTVVDSDGKVCSASSLGVSGCCPNNRDTHHASNNTSSHDRCLDCSNIGCCPSYERCVACCSDPHRADELPQVIAARPAARLLLRRQKRVRDQPQPQFEWCAMLCRTGSQSTQHQNKYRHPTDRYCYGLSPPPLVLTRLK